MLTILLLLTLAGTNHPACCELTAAPAAPSRQQPLGEPSPPQGLVRIATWNIENFFDRYDDPWRQDEVTRPAYVSKGREQRLAAVLKQLDADLVCLQEVENRFHLEDFLARHLPDAGYEVVHIEGNDGRGIDVALLSRLPVGAVTSYRHLEFEDSLGRVQRFQRDLLRVQVGPPLEADVYVVHLKSQHGGEEADALRAAEAAAMARILKAELAASPGYRALLAGDVNDTPDSITVSTLLAAGFVDCGAERGWVTYNREPYLSRIDYILLSPALQRGVRRVQVLDGADVARASDHNPVLCELESPRR